jgi:hypothetical protein
MFHLRFSKVFSNPEMACRAFSAFAHSHCLHKGQNLRPYNNHGRNLSQTKTADQGKQKMRVHSRVTKFEAELVVASHRFLLAALEKKQAEKGLQTTQKKQE